MDRREGLCSDGPSPHGCFLVFLHTVLTRGLVLPRGDPSAEWWAEAYRLVAKEGRAELPPVGWLP